MKQFLTAILITISTVASGQSDKVFLFSYFRGNGEDGLHLAFSRDGLNFTALNDDKPFLTPAVGESKLMRDPCIIRTPDGTFHMVWTAGWTERGIGYASSRDLINWTEQKYLRVMENEPSAKNCWAPEIIYNKRKKEFLIIWSTTIPVRFPETDKSGDSGYNHRIYAVTTKDFINLSETRLFYDRGFNVIDASINSSGRRYFMLVKDETRYPPEKNIRITTSKKIDGPYSYPSEPITGDYWAEGPTAVCIDGIWHVYFDKYTENKMGAVISKNLKNWEDISDKVLFPQGIRHGTVFETNESILQKIINHGKIR